MTGKNPQLSVVIPAYNEEENFRRGVLEDVASYLANAPFTSEIVVVDDGSTDPTPDLVEAWIKGRGAWRIIRNRHKGKAHAVSTGIMAAAGTWVLFTDFDQATPLSEIEKLLPFMSKGYDIAIGSREVKGSKREDEPLYRHIMGRGWNYLVQMLAIKGIRDTQCGFKLFKAEVAKELFSSLSVYSNREERLAYTGAFDVELLFIALKWGLQIAEVPVHWKHVHTTRINPVRDSLRMLMDLIQIRLASVQGKYDR